MVDAPSRLHTPPRGNAIERTCRNAILGVLVGYQLVAFGVVAREVEQVDPSKNDKEPAEKGDCVDGIGGVEAAEEYERGTQSSSGEGYVVERVDSVTQISRPNSPKIP